MRRPTSTPKGRTLTVPRAKLAAVIERLADDYAHFVTDAPKAEEPPDPKDYALRQAAARAGLAHIVELTALTTEDSADIVESSAEEILETARAEIAQESRAEAAEEGDA